MTLAPLPPSETVLALRRAFDAAFASPPAPSHAVSERLLAIGLGGDPFAMRLKDVAGLFKDRRVRLLPASLPHFLGVASLQGRPVPVYDLRRVFGYNPTPNPRWLVLVPGPVPLGLAFDSFEGQFAALPEHLVAEPGGRAGHVKQAVRTGETLRRIVEVASVVETVGSQAGAVGPAKEH